MPDLVSPFPHLPPAERESLRTPDDVAVILRLHELGWGAKRIAREVGCSKNTVKRYLAQGEWRPARSPARPGQLAALTEWLADRFRQHRGNADVVRQDLIREHGITVSLRTVERAVAPLRQALRAEARATVRFETAPGDQLQIDFGERTVVIAGVKERCYFFVATLGYSRRPHVRVFRHQRQAAWLEGLESALRAFGGVPRTVLVDNAKPLVLRHDPATREVTFHPRFLAFAQHWGVRPQACAPYRARTKGKDERGVGYVKHNAIAGHTFESFAALEAHLERWTREVAEVRVHGTTDCTIELHRNWYSVPWQLLGESVRVVQQGEQLTIHHGAAVVATHHVAHGSRVRRIDATHLVGISARRPVVVSPTPAPVASPAASSLLRPLSEYATIVGEAAA